MVITVRPWKALFAASIKAFSVSESKELVASSSIRHTDPLSTERANENLNQMKICFCSSNSLLVMHTTVDVPG